MEEIIWEVYTEANMEGFGNKSLGYCIGQEKDIKKYFIQADVTCVLFEGTSVNIIDKKTFSGGFLNNFEEAFKFIRSKLNTKYIIEEKRTEILELPKEAIREALMNAMVHRDYFSTGHVQINIFIDRVEISNPGGLVKGLKKEKLGKVSRPRNQLLFDIMARTPNVEKAGTGIQRIRDAMKDYGLGVEFESDGFFTVTFEREKVGSDTKSSVKTTQKTTQKIMQAIVDDPQITRKTLADRIGLTEDGIKYHLNNMQKKRLLRRIGPDKGGHWEIVGKKSEK